jgi:hypothetical protein
MISANCGNSILPIAWKRWRAAPALSKAEGLEGANRSRIAYRFAASAMTSPATRGSLTESSSQRIRPPVDHYKGLDEPAI